jgi:hypothetical protein
MNPLRPEHADKIEKIPGVDSRLRVKRTLAGYAYPVNGNVHNPTPRYVWLLLVDDRIVDTAPKRGTLIDAARASGHEYIAEVDGS